MGSPHQRSARTGRTPEAASEPREPAEAGCAHRPGAGGWGQADRSKVWDLPSGESTRSKPHPPSQQVEAVPRPPRSLGRTRGGRCGGSMRPGGPRPRAPAPRSPSPCPQRRCPVARAPRCRSAQACRPVRPVGGAALLRVRRAPPRAPRARYREGARPPPPVSPPAEGPARRPRWAARRGGGGWGSPRPAPPLSFSVPAGRAPGSPGRSCPLVAHFGREREDSRGPRALAGRRFLPGHRPVDRDPHPESARPAIGVVPASLRGTPPSAWRDGLTWTGSSARSVRACPPWGRAGRLCPPLLHPLIEDESPQSVLYSVYARSHLEGRS